MITKIQKTKLKKILNDAYEEYVLGNSKMDFASWLHKNPVGMTYFKKIKKLKSKK